MELKAGIRCVGIDDAPFDRKRKGDVLALGAIYRGGRDFDGLLSTRIRQDGFNATDKLIRMIADSKFAPQLRYALIDGIALGGFNIIDLPRFHAETGLKCLVVMRKKPDLPAMRRAIGKLSMPARRLRVLERAGPIRRVGGIYGQWLGMEIEEVEALLATTCTRSKIPEPLRAAHLIGGGLVLGQSGRRA